LTNDNEGLLNESMRLNWKTGFLLGFLVSMIILWTGMYISDFRNLFINKFWGLAIDFLALFGAIFGLFTAKHWGGFKSAVGKGILYLSAGLLIWSIGNFVFSYYVFFLNNSIPYPSVADAIFIFAWPLWMLGTVYLGKATGVKYGLKRKAAQLYLVILPVISIAVSYYLLVTVARGGVISAGGDAIKIFFDFAYPVGDILIITIAFLVYGLSLKYLGGTYRLPIITILLGFVLMFFADFLFVYTTTLGTYYGGSPIDLLYVAALFTIGFGISSMDVKNS
jgi:two-component system, sensor histidine kinase and response regulator